MTYKIEDIPVPKEEKKENRGRKAKYPLAKLKVGQSFFVKDDKGKIKRGLLTTVINQFKRNHNSKAVFDVQNKKNGFRIYRIK